MEELNNVELKLKRYEIAIKSYHKFPKANSTAYKIIASRSVLTLLYNLYQHYLLQADYNDLYTFIYRKIATIFKWHNRHKIIYNHKHNLIFVNIEDYMFFMFYIRVNDLFTSLKLFTTNLLLISNNLIIN